jgi:hypothetical protein
MHLFAGKLHIPGQPLKQRVVSPFEQDIYKTSTSVEPLHLLPVANNMLLSVLSSSIFSGKQM